MGVKTLTDEYPAWICDDCGRKYGRAKNGVSTYHDGDKCGWCGEETFTTEPRDWGYPSAPKSGEEWITATSGD